MKTIIFVIGSSCALFYMTGCAGSVTTLGMDRKGYARIEGNGPGLDAMGRVLVGIAEQAKATPDRKTAFWQNQDIWAGLSGPQSDLTAGEVQ